MLEDPEQFDFFENQKPTSEVISEHLISKHFLGSAGLLHAYAQIIPPPQLLWKLRDRHPNYFEPTILKRPKLPKLASIISCQNWQTLSVAKIGKFWRDQNCQNWQVSSVAKIGVWTFLFTLISCAVCFIQVISPSNNYKQMDSYYGFKWFAQQ